MKREEVLSKTQELVSGLIKRFAPDPSEECAAALAELTKLTKQSKELFAGDDVPDYFAEGIQSVITHLDAFRTGFARPYDPAVLKSDALKPVTKEMTLVEFVGHANAMIGKAIKLYELGLVGKSLEALRTLNYDANRASNFENKASESITVTVENDPMKIVQTVTPGTTAPSGTSLPTTAPANYATNPAAVSAPSPTGGASAQNLSPSKDVATTTLAGSSSNSPAGGSNFIAAGGGDGIAKDASAAKSEDVTKAADEEVTKAFGLLMTTLNARDVEATKDTSVWPDDLSSPSFLQGVKKRETF